MTLREYAKLMNDTALQGSLSNEEYNRLYKPLLDGIQSMIPPMLFRYRSCNELSLQALWDDKIWLSKGNVMNDDYDALLYTLDGYIAAHNSTLTIVQRKGIAQQILRAFDYLHSKGHLHRDISPKNILIKEYDDTLVVKLSDFGLVKIPDSTLTTVNTEFKGYFNDPALVVEGFNTYGIVHETYALTRVIYFVMTGKTNTEKITNQNLRAFVEKGLNPDKIKRFQNIRDMISAFKAI